MIKILEVKTYDQRIFQELQKKKLVAYPISPILRSLFILATEKFFISDSQLNRKKIFIFQFELISEILRLPTLSGASK
jgi:hypothetical protein